MAENKGLLTEIAQELRKDDDLLLRVSRGHWEDIVPIILTKFREVVEGAENPYDLTFKDEQAEKLEQERHLAFEVSRKAILKAIDKEG